MLNRNRKDNLNCVKSNVNCITWNLAPIPCLGIETGDMLDDVTFAIVRKLCEREDEFDLENIDLQTLVEKFNITEPADKTVHTLLQLCVDNSVKLHDLFSALRDSISGNTGGFSLDLKCYKELDAYGNQVPYDEQYIFQKLIDESCSIRDEFTDVQEVIDALLGGGDGGIYVEPIITETCIFDSPTTPKRHSEYTALFASKFCQYKTALGTEAEWQEAISRSGGSETEDSGWNERFATDQNYYQVPANAAQSFSNSWMAVNNLNTRLSALEDCACKMTCKDLTVGFGITAADNGIYVDFAPQYGNQIPTGFELTGDNNKISFTDKNGKRMTWNITSLATEDTVGPYDISKLAQDGLISVNVCVGFVTPTGEFCNRCVSDTYDPNTSTCNFCEIRANAPVTIMYKSCSTTESGNSNCIPKVLKLNAGEDAAIRKSYKVTYISDPDAIDGIDCLMNNIEDWDTIKCYVNFLAAEGDTSRLVYGIRYRGTDIKFNNDYGRVDNYYETEKIIGEILREVPQVLNASSYAGETDVKVVRTGIFGWGRKTVVGYKASTIQIQVPEDIARELFMIFKVNQNDNEDFQLVYSEFVERSEVAISPTECCDQNGMPPSLCF